MLYICKECGTSFEEPYEWYDDPSPSGVSLSSGAYCYQECPNCESEDFEEAKECEKCGKAFFGNGYLCDYCKADFITSLKEVKSLYGLDERTFEEEISEVLWG